MFLEFSEFFFQGLSGNSWSSQSQKLSENSNARDLANVLRLAFRRKWLEKELIAEMAQK